MRNDFAVFILTHGRADNVVTVPAIKKAGYTGKIYFIIDDEDEQAEEYKKNFGADRVIIFDKQAAYDGQIRWIISMTTGQSFMLAMYVGGLRKNWG